MSEFSGWNQDGGGTVWVRTDQIETLKALGLEVANLKEPSSGFGGRLNWKSWRISPSYRLQLEYDYAFPEKMHISFPKVVLPRSPGLP